MYKQTYKITAEVYPTHYLRRCARIALDAGIAAEKSGDEIEAAKSHYLTCIIFCAFTFEAFLNYIGGECIAGYEYMEKGLTPIEKLKFLSAQKEIQCDSGQRPVQTIATLFDFRNFMAHGKTVRGTEQGEMEIEETHWAEFKRTREINVSKIADKDERRNFNKWTRFQGLCRADFAADCLTDIEILMSVLAEAIGLMDEIRAAAGTDTPIWERFSSTQISAY